MVQITYRLCTFEASLLQLRRAALFSRQPSTRMQLETAGELPTHPYGHT
jgi:hypothetical protein